MDDSELSDLKSQWNDVLDDLEATNRVAWIALFDGRLASLIDDVVIIDFSDATKLAGTHEFERDRRPSFLAALNHSIERVTGRGLTVEIATRS